MSVELVTGQGASDHIGSEDFGAFNAYTFGVGNYVLSGCEAEAIDANTIRVNAGELLLQGRHVRVKGFEDIKIQSGSPGRNRNDLLVVRYTKDAGNIEDAPVVALPGTPIEGTAQDPAHVNGSILDGDLAVDIPLYRIKITGITVAPPELLIERTGSLRDSLSQKADAGHKHSASDITSGTLPVTRGGTGATSAAAARTNLGITPANIGAATSAEVAKSGWAQLASGVFYGRVGNKIGIVQVVCSIGLSATWTSKVLGTLPVGYRPKYACSAPVEVENHPASAVKLGVETNGTVSFRAIGGAAPGSNNGYAFAAYLIA